MRKEFFTFNKMNSFKEYIINEFKVDGTTSILFKFAHALNVKLDKKSQKVLNNHTINVTVQFYDKELNLLRRELLKFVNNELNKKDAERLVNISPKELVNRFNLARREIVQEIKNDYMQKMADINDKINMLNSYENVDGTLCLSACANVRHEDVIPTEFKGELIRIKDSCDGVVQINDKQKFDM